MARDFVFPKAGSKSQSDSSIYSDEDILDTLRTCYRGGVKQPGSITNPTCAALLRKYGVNPDELIEKTRFKKGEYLKTADSGKKVYAKVPYQAMGKRYRNPGQIIGGLQAEALSRPKIKQILLDEGIIKPREERARKGAGTQRVRPSSSKDSFSFFGSPTIHEGCSPLSSRGMRGR